MGILGATMTRWVLGASAVGLSLLQGSRGPGTCLRGEGRATTYLVVGPREHVPRGGFPVRGGGALCPALALPHRAAATRRF